MNRDNPILSDLGIMMRKPVIAGTRTTAELILEKLAAATLRVDVVYSAAGANRSRS